MTKFADELFTDLMREHGAALEHLSRKGTQKTVGYPPTDQPGQPRRRRRRLPPWLTPVAAAACVVLVVGLAVSLGSVFTGRAHPGRKTGNHTALSQTPYLFNQVNGTLTPVLPGTGRLGKPLQVGPGTLQKSPTTGKWYPLDKYPTVVQVSIAPDGRTAYALDRLAGGATFLRQVDLATGRLGKTIQLGRHAGRIAITPDQKTAYVTYQRGFSPLQPAAETDTVVPVSLATGAVGKPILQGDGRIGQIQFTPDGTAYAITFFDGPGFGGGTLRSFSTATYALGRPIPVPGVSQFVMTANGTILDVMQFVRRHETVTPISTATGTVGQPVNIGRLPLDVLITPDGKTAYTTTPGIPRMRGTRGLRSVITPVSLVTGQAEQPIELNGRLMLHAAITPDGKTIYVSSFVGRGLIPISTATNTVGKPIQVSGSAAYMAISPDSKTIYPYSNGNGTQTITPISTATNSPGKPIRIPEQNVWILVPGDQTLVPAEQNVVPGGQILLPGEADL